MTLDLTKLLQEWPYEPGQINVRLIEGDDGTAKIQMRLDLGVLQMEAYGRPDGVRPHGYESLLEYFEAQIDDEGVAGEEENLARLELTPEDCRLLREEAVQYYHRYISLLVLADYTGVMRDTSRNLRVLDLCADNSQTQEDRTILEQFRPYITMMRTRAIASRMVADEEAKAALVAIDSGIDRIREFYEAHNQLDEFERASEIQLLRGMRAELVLKLPASQKTELRERLRKAIEDENYELAAILRDELKMMKD